MNKDEGILTVKPSRKIPLGLIVKFHALLFVPHLFIFVRALKIVI